MYGKIQIIYESVQPPVEHAQDSIRRAGGTHTQISISQVTPGSTGPKGQKLTTSKNILSTGSAATGEKGESSEAPVVEREALSRRSGLNV